MGYLYILESEKNGRYYIGSTNNLSRRLAEHNGGHTTALKSLLPVKLVFSQFYDNLLEARRMELHLKKMKSRSVLMKIIKEGVIKTTI